LSYGFHYTHGQAIWSFLMSKPGNKPSLRAEKADIFGSTSWTAVLQAQSGSPQARKALEQLCNTYWFPIYAYIRHRGYNTTDAEDLTQGFFQFFLNTDRLQIVDRTKGKFRAFLLHTVKGFLVNHWDYIHAAKRGGGKVIMSLDAQTAENRYDHEPSVNHSPDKEFDRRWAHEVLQKALWGVEEIYQAAGKQELYNQLNPFLMDQAENRDYERVAAQLSMSTNAVAVSVHRLRQQYRECVRKHVAQTVSTPGEVEEEMRFLFHLLSEA